MSDIQITHGYNGAVVSASIGDMLMISLPENPTTGFRWTPDSEANILSFAGDEFQSGSQAEIGGGGIRIFRFSARRAGSAQIRCVLARAWEAGPPRDTFCIQISVSQG